jgi:hypothetical protein
MTDGGTEGPGRPFAGAISSTSEFNVENNIINGFKNSIAFYDPLSDTEGGLTAFKGYGKLTAGAKVFIQYNSFLNDEIAVNNGEESSDVSAQCNWWGVYKVQDMLSRFSLGTVSPLPWLIDGTDTDPSTTGFQPADGTCTGAAPVVVLDGSSNVTCNGAANGSAQITAIGGFGPLQFKWTKEGDADFVSTDEDPANFGPGTYHLAVTDNYGSTLFLDANGDLHTIDVTITEPDAISSTFNSTNIACYGNNNGSASIEASGGTGTLSYLWSNGETGNSVSGLPPGYISVDVSDENGCVISKSATITQPAAPLSVTMTGTSASCNGSVTATAGGGTAPYNYLWNNGATTSSISNVPAGTYDIIVTDANNCTTNGTLSITGNATLNPSVQITDLNCAGSNNGVITVTNANGIAPFEYNINGGAFQSSNVFGNLAAGTYMVGVRDAGGCSDFVTKAVLEPAPLVVALDRVLPPCYGATDGRIYILVSGGTGSTSYSWTGPGGFTSALQNPTKLSAGDYHVTVTDAKGCSNSLNVNLPSQPQIIINEVVNNIACRGTATGSIDITLSGGTGSGFAVQWTSATVNTTTEDISGLTTGNYNLSVTDIGSGCVVTKTYTITQPASVLSLSAKGTNATGCSAPGTITATGAGGTSPYQFKIDNGQYQSSGTFSGLYGGGTYTVWVKDANNCTSSKAITITDNGSDEYESNNSKNNARQITPGVPINARIALATDVADWFRFNTSSSGSYIITLTHPSAGFTFNIYPAGNNAPALVPTSITSTTKQYTLIGGSTYYVSITGGLSYLCYSLSVAQVIGAVRAPSQAIMQVMPFTTGVYPNPHQGSFKIRILSPETTEGHVMIINNLGQVVADRKVGLIKGTESTVDFNGMKQGILYYKVIVGKETKTGKIIKD